MPKRISKTIGIFTAFYIAASPIIAQEVQSETEQKTGISQFIMDNFVLLLGVVLIIWALLSLWRMLNMMMDIQKMKLIEEHGPEVIKEAGFKKRQSLWSNLHEKAWNLVPLSQEGEIDLGHDYDGIRELDNKLPPWWVALFYGTIIFGMGYWYYYEMSGKGMGQIELYEYEIAQAEIAQAEYLAKQANLVDESNVVFLDDEAALAKGASIYKMNCVACHGPEGQGTVGPNLTDPYWIHGGGIKNIFKTIKYGVPAKGMIPWKTQLNPAAMQQVASYIMTLEGTNPPNPKAPEGDKWSPEKTE